MPALPDDPATGGRPPPALSAILLVPRSFAELAATVFHLQAQTLRPRIEVVLVHTPGSAPGIDLQAFDGFAGVRLVERDAIPTVAAGFVAGLEAATAPIVALVEDHVWLHPEWAARTLDAHRSSCAAVAPLMSNVNPGTATSWANFLVCFLESMAGPDPGDAASGPGHNTSYKRETLLHYGERLRDLYQSERTFHYHLHADGYTIRTEPRARLGHINLSLPSEAISHAFTGGALFGQYRSREMPLEERLMRTLLAPLVPALRFGRLRRALGRSVLANTGLPSRTWAMVGVLLLAHAAGEVAGYWRLLSEIEGRYERFELHRLACLRPEERRLMLDTPPAADRSRVDRGA